MTKLVAMPSPNRTNFEGLYQAPRGGSAFDAAPRRRARDADPNELMGAMSGLQSHLKAKLTGDDFGTANELLAKVMDILAPQDPDDDDAEADPDDRGAEDRRRRLAGDGYSQMDKLFPNSVMPRQNDGPRLDPRSAAQRFGDLAMPAKSGGRW